MRKKILGHLAEFRRLERSAEISDKRKKLPPLLIPESLELRYRIYYSDKRLISLRLTDTVMAMGQMHPIDYYEYLRADLSEPTQGVGLFTKRQRAVFIRQLGRRTFALDTTNSELSQNELDDVYNIDSLTNEGSFEVQFQGTFAFGARGWQEHKGMVEAVP